MAAYGIDSLDPAVTPRRVAVLLRHLPPWARGGGEAWTTESELLALVADRLSILDVGHAARRWRQERA